MIAENQHYVFLYLFFFFFTGETRTGKLYVCCKVVSSFFFFFFAKCLSLFLIYESWFKLKESLFAEQLQAVFFIFSLFYYCCC